MAVSASSNTQVWVYGQTVDPVIVLANNAATDETVYIKLYDVNGNIVIDDTTGTAVPANGVTTVNYGDVMSAQTLAPAEGFYTIRIITASYTITIPLIIASAAAIDLPTPGADVPGTARIHAVMVQHKPTGLVAMLPPDPNTRVPYTDNFIVMAYLHDDAAKKGAIWYRDGTNSWVATKWARRAIIEYTYQFNSYEEMASWLILHNKDGSLETLQALGRLFAEGRYQSIARVAQLHFVEPAVLGLGRLLDYKVDLTNLTVTVKSVVTIGFGWFDVKRALAYAAAGAIMGAGIVAAGASTVLAPGVGGIIGGAIVGATVGFATDIIAQYAQGTTSTSGGGGGLLPSSDNYIGNVKDVGEQGKKNIEQSYNDIVAEIDTLEQNGVLTQQQAQRLRELAANLKNVAITAIDDTITECKAALDKCVSDYRLRMMVSGVGGAVAGYIVGKV